MKTLVLNGSPHPGGDTAALLGALLHTLDGEAEVISAFDANIAPCNDCRWCWQNKGCIIQDAMQPIYQKLAGCDNIVVAAPIHNATLPAPLLALFSRTQTYFAQRVIRKISDPMPRKRGALLLVGGGAGGPGSAIEPVVYTFRTLRTEYIGLALSHNTDAVPAHLDADALQRAAELGKELAQPQTGAP